MRFDPLTTYSSMVPGVPLLRPWRLLPAAAAAHRPGGCAAGAGKAPSNTGREGRGQHLEQPVEDLRGSVLTGVALAPHRWGSAGLAPHQEADRREEG